MTESISITADFPPSIRERFEWATRVVAWADEMGPVVRAEIQREAPVKTNRLHDSIRYSRTMQADGASLKWTANTPYADFVIHGTKEHEITPKAALALHFTDAHGDAVFARFVHHRGSKPNDFPARAAKTLEPRLLESFHRHITEGL